MKAVVIGEGSGATMDRADPFILERLVKSYVIRDWNDTLLT